MARSTPVPAKPVPQTDEEAAYHAQEYVKADEAVKQLDAEQAQELAAVQQRYADRKKPLVDAREEHLKLAHAWGEANRAGRKTIKLPNGRELQWRLPSSPTLIVAEEALEKIIRALFRRNNGMKYLKIELRKNEIKADLPELQKGSKNFRTWFRLSSTEYFRIK